MWLERSSYCVKNVKHSGRSFSEKADNLEKMILCGFRYMITLFLMIRNVECIIPLHEKNPNGESENICSHFANTFPNTDDTSILLPLGMSFEPESMPGQNQ